MKDLNLIKGFRLGPLPSCMEDVFYAETREFSEVSVKELDMLRARSFRADLLHKLNIIRLAFKSWPKSARELYVSRMTIWKWISGRTSPGHNQIIMIDNTYQLAIEMLCQAKRHRSRAEKKVVAEITPDKFGLTIYQRPVHTT